MKGAAVNIVNTDVVLIEKHPLKAQTLKDVHATHINLAAVKMENPLQLVLIIRDAIANKNHMAAAVIIKHLPRGLTLKDAIVPIANLDAVWMESLQQLVKTLKAAKQHPFLHKRLVVLRKIWELAITSQLNSSLTLNMAHVHVSGMEDVMETIIVSIQMMTVEMSVNNLKDPKFVNYQKSLDHVPLIIQCGTMIQTVTCVHNSFMEAVWVTQIVSRKLKTVKVSVSLMKRFVSYF